jgi:hypothetical protein
MSIPDVIAATGTWMPVRLGIVPPTDEALDHWRLAHKRCVAHLRTCVECGIDLCADGQTLWSAADDAERALPWRAS